MVSRCLWFSHNTQNRWVNHSKNISTIAQFPFSFDALYMQNIFFHIFFFKFKYKIFENGINLKSQWIAIARKRDKNLFEIIVKIFGYCGKHETVHWSSSQERFVLMIKLNFFRWQQQQQNEYLFDVIWPFRIVTNVEHLLNCRPIYLSRGHSLCMNWK